MASRPNALINSLCLNGRAAYYLDGCCVWRSALLNIKKGAPSCGGNLGVAEMGLKALYVSGSLAEY
jgi:hypothetical protein